MILLAFLVGALCGMALLSITLATGTRYVMRRPHIMVRFLLKDPKTMGKLMSAMFSSATVPQQRAPTE